MQDDLEKELCEKGIYTPVVGIVNTGNKEKRIHSLEPLVNKGTIQFMTSQKILLDQFMYFPNGEHDDGLDALEMIVSNIDNTPSGLNGVSHIKINSPKSPVLTDVIDQRSRYVPRVDNGDKKDRFVPDPNDY
ncbi:MAG: phage terminase large subunit [Candidatus Omnitrophica bacterium]|nr:phage terminase large subunit [Candidatus Omnitrophota bacterium]